MTSVTVTVVSGGLSQAASTKLLADRLAEATRQQLAMVDISVELAFVELRDLATDIANNLVTGFPGTRLRQALETVTGADALIAVSPVFLTSYSGLFKSFFDIVDDDALVQKPTLIAATGGTPRHSLALEYAMRPLFSYLRAIVVPTAVFASTEDWGGAGDMRTEDLPTRISRAARELAALLVN